MGTRFDSWQLQPELASTISKLGWNDCTPIQESAIPLILQGKDVAGLAQTGTGKTGAFMVPLIERLLCSVHPSALTGTAENANGSTPSPTDLVEGAPAADAGTPEGSVGTSVAQRAFLNWQRNNLILVLVPTRELAEQVAEQGTKLGGHLGIKVEPIYGGVGYDKQTQALRDGVQIVVATPGRLIDLYKEHLVDLRQVRAVVFDEADRMFDMGFKDDMKFLLSRIPRDRQFLVFSATLNFDVLNTAYQFGAHPVEINISRDQAKAENVKDEIFHVGQEDKPKYLLSLFKQKTPKQAIVFSNFKNNVERIAKFLADNGIPAVGISSLLTQAQRNRVMEQFKAEDHPVNVLVATDVAARGLDIQGVDLVINFELPDDPENYVHRIGRTGRAGAQGHAYSFVSDRDVDALTRLEDYLQNKINVGWVEDADLVSEFKPFPSMNFSDGKPYSAESRPRDNGRGGGGNGRGPRRGGGDRGDRRGGSDGRRDRRDRRDGPKPQAAPMAEQNGSTKVGATPQHRDRVNGRHSGSGNEQRSARHAGNGGEHRNGPSRRPGPHGSNSSRPTPRRGHHDQRPRSKDGRRHDKSTGQKRTDSQIAVPVAASLGQKVSRFFKRLIGG
jgi:superfamily II DNA/RNA helicase